MKKYIFNRNEFTWAEEFYDVIKKKMELPDYFGRNADALWDMLTGYIDTPCEIVLVGFLVKRKTHIVEIFLNGLFLALRMLKKNIPNNLR